MEAINLDSVVDLVHIDQNEDIKFGLEKKDKSKTQKISYLFLFFIYNIVSNRNK